MEGIAPPLVTPFTENGGLDTARLTSLVAEMESAGVGFLVVNGSTSEAPACTVEERQTIVETVIEQASVPVLVGTGCPGLDETLNETAFAADAGADGALVVTPYYYAHDQAALASYYRLVADEADLPIYLYSVPKFTGLTLKPETVSELASHPNIAGMKDSAGSLSEFVRTLELVTDPSFDLFVGAGGILAPALQAGASGGILAVANVAPGEAVDVYSAHRDGKHTEALDGGRRLVSLNHAVTGVYGIPELKWAMRQRGLPAGHSRPPFQPASPSAQSALADHLDQLGSVSH